MKLEKITSKGADYLFRHPESGMFYFRRYTTATGEITKSLRTKDLNEAKRIRDELIFKRQKPYPNKFKMTALEHFDKWMIRKESLGAAEGTMTSIRASRRYLKSHFSFMLLSDITAEWWESEYIPKAKELAHSRKRKFFNDRKWLIAFLHQMKDDGAIAAIPNIRKVDTPSGVGKIFSDEDIETLLNFAQNEDLHLAILMAVTMGMRRMEIFGLSLDRIDLAKRTITLKAENTKTRRERSFAISEDCWPIIFRRASRGGVWLFPSKHDQSRPLHKDGYMTAWRNLKREHKISGRFHDLRHTFLTKAFKESGVNPALICYYAGLSMEVAEKIYLHFTAADTLSMTSLVSFSDRKVGETDANA